jgi:hypothetical protein
VISDGLALSERRRRRRIVMGRLVLILLQLAAGWFGAPEVLRYVPLGGDAQIFAQGVAAGLIVWIVGLVGAQVLKGVSAPSLATLASALAGGLIGAAVVVSKLPAMLPFGVPPLLWMVGLAVVGYALKR